MANRWKYKAKDLQRRLNLKDESLRHHISVLDEYSKEIKSLTKEVEYWKRKFIQSENAEQPSEMPQSDGIALGDY